VLATFLVALIGAGIAFRQYQIQKYRLRLDLSERRLAVFSATRELLRSAVFRQSTTDDSLVTFDLATAEAVFLFQDDVTGYLDQLRNKYCEILEISDVEHDDAFADADERAVRLGERREHKKWMREQLAGAQVVFKRYLDLSKA
jgi:hypothetical protein